MEAPEWEPVTRSLSSRVILTKHLRVQISLPQPSKSLFPLCWIFLAEFCHVDFLFPMFFRYSSINEINKITQQNTEMKVFVYFITRLPRMEGGTSYVGFHGGKVHVSFCFAIKLKNSKKNQQQQHFLKSTGPWRAAHIDDLRQSKDIVSDIKVLQNMTISQMFETQNSEPEGNWLIIMSADFHTHTIYINMYF